MTYNAYYVPHREILTLKYTLRNVVLLGLLTVGLFYGAQRFGLIAPLDFKPLITAHSTRTTSPAADVPAVPSVSSAPASIFSELSK